MRNSSQNRLINYGSFDYLTFLYRKIEHSVHLANAQEVADRSRMVTRDEGRDMDWEDYHDTDTIYAWLDELEGK